MSSDNNYNISPLRDVKQQSVAHAGTTDQRTFEECVICLQAISERAVAVPCNHLSFDFICLASWVQEHATCPLCKTELVAIQYDFRAVDDFKTYNIPDSTRKALAGSHNATATSRNRPYQNRFRQRGPFNTRRPGSAPPASTPDTALQRRRYIYRHNFFSLHVGSNRLSRFQEFTPQDFSRSAELQARARKWIRRELQVFDFLSPDAVHAPAATSAAGRKRVENAEFLLMYIVAILKTVDIKGSSGKAEEMLQSYLGGENARLFLHELAAWLRSPYTQLEDWDRHVQYAETLPYFGQTSKNERSEALPARGNGANLPRPDWSAGEQGTSHNTARWQAARRRFEPD